MQLVSLARNPVPSGAQVGHFVGNDGVVQRFARWDATRGPRRGTVCVFQGRGEFIEKYFEVIADLRRRGFAVATLDWRGQGASQRQVADPRKGHVHDFADYDGDLVRFMKDVVLPDCPPPFIALAHSMGGNILLRAATISGSWFDRMVLTAPMLALSNDKVPVPQPLARAFVAMFGYGPLGRLYVPGGSAVAEETKPFEDNRLTSDPDRYARNRQIIEAAPELGLGSPTIRWLKAAYRSCNYLMHPEFAPQVRVPVLMVAAGQDRIVSTSAIEILAGRLKIGARVSLTGSQHELLQEKDDIRQRFWAAFDAYLGVHGAAAA